MNDKEYQINNLENIFSGGMLAPVFKVNTKFSSKDGCYPRIMYDDVMNYKYIIRWCDSEFLNNRFYSDLESEVIAEYQSIDELVHDGWRLD